MIQTINPYDTARTAEIMSRYRPIAPKPEPPSSGSVSSDSDQNSTGLPHSISKSPYLRNVWAHLQARPTRTRKRGRTAAFAPPSSSVKRSRTCLQGLTPPYAASPAKNLAMHGFAHLNANGQISLVPNLVPLKCALDTAVTTLAESVAALPLLRCTPTIDLNKESSNQSPPQELDFMPQLQEPAKPSVITPQPIRPVGSCIIVKSIYDETKKNKHAKESTKKAEEVEKEAEAEAMPVVVSDSGNKVRLANSAYKEMVGQPECCWLAAACGGACRRIGGEVVLRFEESSKLMMSMHGFTCRVKIEWESNGKVKKSVDALCSGVKVACEAKDYQFLWRFNTTSNDDDSSASDI